MKEILRNKEFRLLWTSGVFDNMGRWMDVVVMGLLVLQQTDSAFQVALLFVLRWVPMFVFAIFSGMIADRVNRWRIIFGTRCASVIVTAIVLCLVIIDVIQPWHLFLASLALGWIYVLEFPSRRSMIYEIVGSSRIVSAMSLETIGLTIGRIIGPLTAGFLIEISGFTAPYIVLLVGYTLALASFSLIRTQLPVHSSGPNPIWQNLKDGLRYSFNDRVIRGVLIITLIMNALAFSVESQFPVVAKDHLNVGAGLTGVLISAVSIGSFFGAGGIAWFGVMRYHGRLFCSGVVLQFLSLFLFALSPWYPLSFVFLLATGFGSAGFSTMQSTIILITASPEKRGTSLGVLGLCIGVAAFGGLLIGAVADIMSARIAVAIGSSLGLLLLVPVIALSPLVWRPINPAENTENTESSASDSIDAQQPTG